MSMILSEKELAVFKDYISLFYGHNTVTSLLTFLRNKDKFNPEYIQPLASFICKLYNISPFQLVSQPRKSNIVQECKHILIYVYTYFTNDYVFNSMKNKTAGYTQKSTIVSELSFYFSSSYESIRTTMYRSFDFVEGNPKIKRKANFIIKLLEHDTRY